MHLDSLEYNNKLFMQILNKNKKTQNVKFKQCK